MAARRAVESGVFQPAQVAHLREIIAAEMEASKLPKQEYYTVKQVAQKLGVNDQVLRGYIRDGLIKAKLTRQRYLIHKDELARYEKSLKP